jgi:hypothetical protein
VAEHPSQEYRLRLAARQAEAEAADRRSQALSRARLIVFAVTAAAAWASLTRHLPTTARWSAALWVGVPAALFVALVVVHDRSLALKRRALRAVEFWQQGLQRIEERWQGQGVLGERYVSDAHPYARDLDLFGRGSLFELLCTARTRAGEETLARWLLAGGRAAEVLERQAAVVELRSRLDLREDLSVLGAAVRAEIDPERLTQWGAAPPIFTSFKWWPAVGVVTLVSVAAIVGWLAGAWGWGLVAVAALIDWQVLRGYRSQVQRVLGGVDRPGHDLDVLAGVIARFERESWSSPRLQALALELGDGGEPASARIRQLSRLVDYAFAMRNQFFAVIGFFLVWPVHFAFALERWRLGAGKHVASWLGAVGELEALAALAAYAYEHPQDPFPEIVEAGPLLDGEGLGHPLLPRATVVRNDLELGGELRMLLVSGSNMSGKSTMLRTVGTNVVLALAGAPVRAHRLKLSPLHIGATLRIQDSLAEGTSRFYAEITRLRQLVELAGGQPPLLFLLDEILHGTNSHDRRIGAEAVVRALVDRGAVGLCTTHDLALAELAETLAPRARNVHFEDHMVDGKLEFDYRMRAGVVRKSNAIALMRAVGLDV